MIHGYMRVSSDDQGESGLGLEAQEAAIRRWATGPVTLHQDVCKSQVPLDERPGFLGLMAVLAPGDTVVVYKLDRLARDMQHHLFAETMLAGMGVAMASTMGEGVGDDSPMGTLMRQILQAFSQFERALIRMRTKAALRALKESGHHVGRTPGLATIVDRRRDGQGAGKAVVDPELAAELTRLREAGAGYVRLAEVASERLGRHVSPSAVRHGMARL